MNTSFKPEEYILHFEVQGVPLLLIDLLSNAYTRFIESGIVLYSVAGNYREYVRKTDRELIGEQGAKFFASKSEFAKFLEDLDKGFTKAEQELSRLASPGNKGDLEKFFAIAIGALSPYHRTVEFYTDKAYEKSSGDPVLRQNLEELQRVKDKYRLKLNNLFLERGNALEELTRNLASRFGMSAEDLLACSCTQLLLLFQNKKPSLTEIAHQKAAYFFDLRDGQVLLHTGSEAVTLAKQFEYKVPEVAEVRGIVSSRGKSSLVTGKVRNFNLDYADFLMIRKQMNEMHQGEILVAITTGPELIDAFKKAAAVVTDIGGMLSHAAITSRELNIPCVGGTEFASKIFKTGDMIEVDAEKGIVRKI